MYFLNDKTSHPPRICQNLLRLDKKAPRKDAYLVLFRGFHALKNFLDLLVCGMCGIFTTYLTHIYYRYYAILSVMWIENSAV